MALSEADLTSLKSRLNFGTLGLVDLFDNIKPGDIMATVNSPTLAIVGTSPDGSVAWAMDGAGADEEIGGALVRVPSDISPADATLDFNVLCATSVAGGVGEDVVLDVGLATIAATDLIDEARTLVGSQTIDVSAKGVDELFVVTFSPATVYAAGDQVRVSVRRNSGDGSDDYANDLYILGVQCFYWHKSLQEFAQ